MGSKSRSALGAAIVAVAALALAGCGGGSSAESAAQVEPTTTTVAPGSAKILSLDAPDSVDCAGKTSVTVPVSYATSGAASQELVVDGRLVTGTDAPKSTLDVPLHCDPLPHSVVLVAKDADGRRTTKDRNVMTPHGAGA